MKIQLFTERLKLIPIEKKDLDRLHQFFANEFVRKYLCDDIILPREQIQEFIKTNERLFLEKNYGLWWIQVAVTGELVGIVGLWNFFEEGQSQLLFALLPEFTKKGYAREASIRILNYSFTFLGYENLAASCDLPNKASQNLAERLGMQKIKEEIISEKPIVFFEITKQDFKEKYMQENSGDNTKFPVGEFIHPETTTEEHINAWIEEIEKFPSVLRATIANWTEEQLSTKTKPDGWMVAQVIHHLADSHMNSFIRFKLALTEENPTIKPYAEDRWAELKDGKLTDINSSLQILDALHKRWVILLKSLTPSDLQKTFFHPEQKKSIRLDNAIGMYAWHGRHHLGFIQNLKTRMGW